MQVHVFGGMENGGSEIEDWLGSEAANPGMQNQMFVEQNEKTGDGFWIWASLV